jgi:hypothetical protein
MTTKAELKEHATQLLHRYDAMRKDMRALERDLHKAVRDYAFADGAFVGMTKDTFRNNLQMEQERLERERLEREAERDNWEKHNA